MGQDNQRKSINLQLPDGNKSRTFYTLTFNVCTYLDGNSSFFRETKTMAQHNLFGFT